MPTKGSLWDRLGRELYDLAALHSVTDSSLEAALHRIHGKLLSDPHGILNFVPLSTTGANRLVFAVSVRDDFRLRLAGATHNDGLY